MGITIRAYKNSDEEAVVALWNLCALLIPANHPKKDIARKLKVNPELFLVAEAEGKLLGTVMAGYEGHRGWINYLAVTPDQQKSGIGRRLMEEAERRLKELGCPKINLQVRNSNKAAREFYEKIGYHVEDVSSYGKRLNDDSL